MVRLNQGVIHVAHCIAPHFCIVHEADRGHFTPIMHVASPAKDGPRGTLGSLGLLLKSTLRVVSALLIDPSADLDLKERFAYTSFLLPSRVWQEDLCRCVLVSTVAARSDSS